MTTLRGIYAIVDPARSPATLEYLDALLGAGVRLFQYRDKRGTDRKLVAAMHERVQACGGTLIVNDDVDAAQLAGGVHLGQDDLAQTSIARARALLGNRIVGVSAATPELARSAERDGADYIGTGPYRATLSKPTPREPLGSAGLREVVASVRIPVAAIGGIELDDLDAIVGSGAQMAAVISALCDAPDPAAAARGLALRWERALA